MEKLAIYEEFKGDSDMWSRASSSRQYLTMPEQDWREIDFILQDLTSLKNGLCAADYASDVLRRLKGLSADEEVEKKLVALA